METTTGSPFGSSLFSSDTSFLFSFSFINDRVPVAPVPDFSHLPTNSTDSSKVNGTFLHSNRNHSQPVCHSIQNQSSTLCGFPAFCSNAALARCCNVTLAECGECSMPAAVSFGAVVALLGLAIVAANLVVLWYNLSKEKMNTYSKIKASLAVADILSGLNPLIIAVYNLSWSLNSTVKELDITQLEYRGSPQAIAGGIFYLLGFSSSIYHLVYLTQQRLFAVRWPIEYKMQSSLSVHAGLAIVWLLAIVLSSAPSWFPDVFVFTYSHTIFLFNLNLAKIGDNNYTPLAVMVSIIFIVPFVLATCFTIAAAVLVRKQIAQSKKISRRSVGSIRDNAKRRETSILKTVAIMQFGFTLTIVPVVVIVFMDYNNILNCSNISTPYVICFYLSMSNSLVNVLVYSIRDKRFRKSLCKCTHAAHRTKSHTHDFSPRKPQKRSSHTDDTKVGAK